MLGHINGCPLLSLGQVRARTPRVTSVLGVVSDDKMVDGAIPTRRSCGRSFEPGQLGRGDEHRHHHPHSAQVGSHPI